MSRVYFNWRIRETAFVRTRAFFVYAIAIFAFDVSPLTQIINDKMTYDIPPKYVEMRRKLARSHNRRVLVLFVLLMVFLVAGVRLMASHRTAVYCVFGAAAFVEIAGIIFIIRLSKKQAVAMGYACPLCGGSLYDGRDNRLGFRGECPCCKKFIVDKLQK